MENNRDKKTQTAPKALIYSSCQHGRPVCRARGVKCPPPRFCEANVKSLLLTIGASPDLDCAPPPSFHSHRAPMAVNELCRSGSALMKIEK